MGIANRKKINVALNLYIFKRQNGKNKEKLEEQRKEK